MRIISWSLTKTVLFKRVKVWLQSAVLIVLTIGAMSSMAYAQAPISSVDTSLVGSQKYVLRVAGQPYLLNDIQLRLDKLRYTSTYLWTWPQCEALVAQAAADGFNTVSIPVQWYEVEPSENTFDWTILDNYLTYVNKYNLKMEMLWFGSNSTGVVGWMGDAANPVHLRVPDYVLYAPSYGSTDTTSDYTIDSTFNPYTLADTDPNLLARETYVLGQVMAHIASWDAANGNKHPVIGVQIENEMNGGDYGSAADVVSYLSGVASAVKNSSYKVWTRANTIDSTSEVTARVDENESLRSSTGTNLDFIGRDDYSSSDTNIEAAMPLIGKNLPMIMENSGENNYTIRNAALAGNAQLDTYDMCGPDAGEGLYNQTANNSGTCSPEGVEASVAGNLLMLDQDPVDIALNAQGQGLFFHDWARSGTATTGGTLGITYTPTGTGDEGVSIMRTTTQMVLMSTEGGTFTYPSNYNVSNASKGYFNSNNIWIDQGSVPFTSTAITPGDFTTVLLTYQYPGSSAITLPNFSFESPSTDTYVYNPTGASWAFSGASPSGSGVTTNGSHFTSGNTSAPDGIQVAFLQESGTISQTLSGFTPGNTYTVTFLASQRQTVGSGTQVGQTFDLRINGTTIASFAPPQASSAYTQYYATFTATAATQTVSFVGTNLNGGDNTVFIDQVTVD